MGFGKYAQLSTERKPELIKQISKIILVHIPDVMEYEVFFDRVYLLSLYRKYSRRNMNSPFLILKLRRKKDKCFYYQ